MADGLKYSVYAHVTPSDKIYVGITSQKVSRRWRNGAGYKTSSYFNNAINKYGWDNISHLILYKDVSFEDACRYEVELIAELQTNDRSFGYNLTAGGEGVTGTKWSQEDKERMSKRMSGKGNHMYGISLEGLSGKDNPMYGVPAVNRRKVECITTGKIFDTVTGGAKYYGTFRSDISKVCNGGREYAGTLNGVPLTWRYIYEN